MQSCEKIEIANCPPVIIPSTEAFKEITKLPVGSPLYTYIDDIGEREDFIAKGCKK